MLRSIGVVAVGLLVAVSLAAGQDERSSVAVGGMGVFTKDVSGNGLDQSVTNSGGIFASFRYGFRPHSAIDLTYDYTRNSQLYSNTTAFTFQQQQANVHEMTAAYVYQVGHREKLSPFVLGGGGLVLFDPITISTHSLISPSTDARGAFLYGAGADYRWRGPIGFRLQYRGLIYKAPDFGVATASTGKWTHSAEPSLGVTFHF